MKIGLLLIASCCFGQGIPFPGFVVTASGSPIVLLANAKSTAGGSATVNSTGGTLAIYITSTFTAQLPDTLVDSKGNTPIPLTSYHTTAGNDTVTLWYVCNPVVGSGHSVSNTNGSAFNAIGIAIFSNVNSTCFNSGSDIGANDINATTISPGQGGAITTAIGDLQISFTSIGFGTATLTETIDLGFTIIDQFSNSGVTEGFAWGYLVSPSAIARDPGWLPTATNNSGIGGASFKKQ